MNLYEKYNWLFNESSKPIPGLIRRYYNQYQDGTPVPDGFVYDWNRDQSVKVPDEEDEGEGNVGSGQPDFDTWLTETPYDYNRDGIIDKNDYNIWSLFQYGISIIDIVNIYPDWFQNVIYYDPATMGREVFPVQTPNGIQMVYAPFNNNEAGYYVITSDGGLLTLEEYFAPFQYEMDDEANEGGQP